MEHDDKLKLGVGDKELEKLKPAEVQIIGSKIVPVERAKSEKVVFVVKHPDKEEHIEISSAKVLGRKDQLKVFGIWFKLDVDEKIQKGSTLAAVLEYLNISSIDEATGKNIETIADEDGYLCLKAYK